MRRVHHEKRWADGTQAGSKMAGKISITSDMQVTPPYGRKRRRTEEPRDEIERGK